MAYIDSVIECSYFSDISTVLMNFILKEITQLLCGLESRRTTESPCNVT